MSLCREHIFDICSTWELGRYTAELGKICAQLLLLFEVVFLGKLFLRILLKSIFHYCLFLYFSFFILIVCGQNFEPSGPAFFFNAFCVQACFYGEHSTIGTQPAGRWLFTMQFPVAQILNFMQSFFQIDYIPQTLLSFLFPGHIECFLSCTFEIHIC